MRLGGSETKQTVHSVVLPNLVLGSVTNSDTSFRCVCVLCAWPPSGVAVVASGTFIHSYDLDATDATAVREADIAHTSRAWLGG